jgi:hypothetical protein
MFIGTKAIRAKKSGGHKLGQNSFGFKNNANLTGSV